MQKEFNITGNCFAEQHYMADVSKKLQQTLNMVTRGKYFIINRPRQYGKTTTLYALAKQLRDTGDYVVLNASFEGVGDAIFEKEEVFAKGFVQIIAKYSAQYLPETKKWLLETAPKVRSLKDVENLITEFLAQTDKKVVLLIDEVDKSSNNQLFISFLAMLRNKYLERSEFKTFYSVVLAGVHDVKNLKLKIRPGEQQQYNSPWNIATEFEVNMSLQVEEIIPMLNEYAADKNVKMDAQSIAERLFYYTSGYPFLVSKLCKMMDERFLKHEEWTTEDIDTAVRVLLTEQNTNFESLTKNLKNNPELYDFVYKIAIDNETIPFSIYNELTQLGIIHGIFKTQNGAGVRIHNRIYAELIYEYMSIDVLISRFPKTGQTTNIYKHNDGSLDMEAVMLGFQGFMKKEYSKKDRAFLEKNGRLVFLAFIKPIINGSGHDFKEPQISEEKRLDVVITHLSEKYVAELKVWHGEKAHQKGLLQLADYLAIQSLSIGYLLIFDHSNTKKWQSEWAEVQGKRIFAVWV